MLFSELPVFVHVSGRVIINIKSPFITVENYRLNPVGNLALSAP